MIIHIKDFTGHGGEAGKYFKHLLLITDPILQITETLLKRSRIHIIFTHFFKLKKICTYYFFFTIHLSAHFCWNQSASQAIIILRQFGEITISNHRRINEFQHLFEGFGLHIILIIQTNKHVMIEKKLNLTDMYMIKKHIILIKLYTI